MTPKEKKAELIEKFRKVTRTLEFRNDDHEDGMIWVDDIDTATECAKICVKELIENIKLTTIFYKCEAIDLNKKFWNEVTTEIEKI